MFGVYGIDMCTIEYNIAGIGCISVVVAWRVWNSLRGW